MNNPFDHISGQIMIKGRVYSAKEVIRGLLEQGIAITESSEGLKIGFKLFLPQSTSQQALEENSVNGCPFISHMSQIASRLDDLSTRFDSQANNASGNYLSSSNSSKSPSSPSFSPFSDQSFQTDHRKEKEKFFSSADSFLDNHQKCSSCGTSLPQNAFFCNKCGSNVRSG